MSALNLLTIGFFLLVIGNLIDIAMKRREATKERRQVVLRNDELERIVNEVDDILSMNWVGPRKDGDYRKALANLIQINISEHEYFEVERLKGYIASLESEIETLRRKQEPA